MNKENLKKRLDQLKTEIQKHDHLYYLLGKPQISDAEYDRLFLELQKIEKEHPEWITPDSPTQRVSGERADFLPKFTHRVPLLSLESIFTLEDVLAFDKRIKKEVTEPFQYVVEPKLDGLSIEVVYRNGYFVQAGTRGDSVVGEDVTQNIKTIKTLPLKLKDGKIPPELHIRGEVVMTLEGFRQLNKTLIEEGEEPFANPRNAASGSLRQLDSQITAKRKLDIYLYDLLYATDWKPKTQWEILETFESWGLRVNPLRKLVSSVDEVMQFHQKLFNKRDSLNYEIDGIVAKLDDLSWREILGTRSRSPRWAFALKFESRKEITKIEDIVVQVGRQGSLTPVAILKPVDVGGVTVSRATLHNLDIVRKLDVRVGDEVRVARAGDVIPEVVAVNHEARRQKLPEFNMPSRCPVCDAEIIKEGAYFVCTGSYACPAQMKWSIIHFASRRAMDIVGLGQETVELLLYKNLIANASDLYILNAKKLAGLEGFKDKKIQNLLKGIEESKQRPLDRFLYALGIRHVGEQIARLIVGRFGTLDKIRKAKFEEIQEIRGVGTEIAQSLIDYFMISRNQRLIDAFIQRGVKPTETHLQINEGPFKGKTFVFTGELVALTRDEAKKKVEDLGGHATESVSKNTTYVVIGANPGSKYSKAQKLGVPVLTEEEFLKLIR